MQSTEKALLDVRKIHVNGPVEAEQVSKLMKDNGIAWHRLEQAPWAESYPYRPEVEFAIAHTGQEILLWWRVSENCVRAEAASDNGRVWEDSCCELFLQLTPSHSPLGGETVGGEGSPNYYNIECNCAGKLLVQGGPIGTERPLATTETTTSVKRWSSLGNEPFALKAEPTSWTLAEVIPTTALFLDHVDSFSGLKATGNLYKCGDLLAQPHYLALFPIDLPKPAFHCPQFFRTLVFE